MRVHTANFYRWLSSYIREHPASTYTPWIIMKLDTGGFRQKQVEYDRLSEQVKKSHFGLELKEQIDIAKMTAEIRVEGMAPDFVSNAQDGTQLSLYDVVKKSKLTLVDFWASWCVPCREEMPFLRRAYDNFHKDGFNILSVSLDNNAKSWLKAIASDSMEWYQVSQLSGRNELAAKVFGIDGIPAGILIDSQGKILAIDADNAKVPSGGGSLRGEALYEKVRSILGR